MLDVQAVLAQVAQNEANEEWLIVPGLKLSVINVVISEILMVIFLGIVLTFVALFNFGPAITSNYNISPFSFLYDNPWIFLFYLLFLVGSIYFSWRIQKDMSDSMLILVPEGIILCSCCSDEQRRKVKSFAYADLEDMRLNVVRGTLQFSPAQIKELPIDKYIEEVEGAAFVFKFIYRTSKKATWEIPIRYNTYPAKKIVGKIVVDYAAFTQRQKQGSFAGGMERVDADL